MLKMQQHHKNDWSWLDVGLWTFTATINVVDGHKIKGKWVVNRFPFLKGDRDGSASDWNLSLPFILKCRCMDGYSYKIITRVSSRKGEDLYVSSSEEKRVIKLNHKR